MKANCQKCLYGGLWNLSQGLASCSAPMPQEPTVTKYDELFKKERRFVRRRNWDDECECKNFIPHLSEIDGDFELEAVTTFNASFDCPFCGENVDAYGLGIEETAIVTCNECGREIAVKGKCI